MNGSNFVMKIQCDQQSIRLRLDELEYQQLIKNRAVNYPIEYLNLELQLQIVADEIPSQYQETQLKVFLTQLQAEQLNAETQRKHGINLWLEANTHNVLLTVQLDLHK